MAHYPKLNYTDLNAIKSKTLIIAGDRDVIKNSHTTHCAFRKSCANC